MRKTTDIVPVTQHVQGLRMAAAPENVSWRKLQFRLGSIELSYASAHRRPQAAKPAHITMQRIYRRSSFRERFMGHLAVLIAVGVFVAGSATFWAMQSDAVVHSTTSSWPIARKTPVKPATAAAAVALVPAAVTPVAANVPSPAPAPAPAKSSAPVMLTAPIAELMEEAPVRGGIASLEDVALESIPAVRVAIEQAMSSGQLQSWQAGGYEGVVVIGQPVEADGSTCRKGSILARDSGFAGRTELFVRCTKG